MISNSSTVEGIFSMKSTVKRKIICGIIVWVNIYPNNLLGLGLKTFSIKTTLSMAKHSANIKYFKYIFYFYKRHCDLCTTFSLGVGFDHIKG